VSLDNLKNENDFCLHDRLMFEIKQRRRRLKPIEKSFIQDLNRKRIRPVKVENIFNQIYYYII